VLGIAWHGLIAFERTRDVLPVGAVGVVVAVACSVFLVPSGGDVGAAWAYLLPVTAMSLTAGTLLARNVARQRTQAEASP